MSEHEPLHISPQLAEVTAHVQDILPEPKIADTETRSPFSESHVLFQRKSEHRAGEALLAFYERNPELNQSQNLDFANVITTRNQMRDLSQQRSLDALSDFYERNPWLK